MSHKCSSEDRHYPPSFNLLSLQALPHIEENIIDLNMLPWSYFSSDPNHAQFLSIFLTDIQLPPANSKLSHKKSFWLCQSVFTNVAKWESIPSSHSYSSKVVVQTLKAHFPLFMCSDTPCSFRGFFKIVPLSCWFHKSSWCSFWDVSSILFDLQKYHIFLDIIPSFGVCVRGCVIFSET